MNKPRKIVWAILAKDKAHCLPRYLECLERQTIPKKSIHLYIRTNNNNDETVKVLREWITKVKGQYASVRFSSSNVPEPVERYAPHEWNQIRFRVLGSLRQQSVQYAIDKKCHYFVSDVDNFITPIVLEKMLAANLPVVAPMLTTVSAYSNYHHQTDSQGYLAEGLSHGYILSRAMKGLIECDVVHCTYFIRHEFLKQVSYDDRSGRHEYVIFSDTLRKGAVPEYLDNRYEYGRISFADTLEGLESEVWINEFPRPAPPEAVQPIEPKAVRPVKKILTRGALGEIPAKPG